MKNLLLVLAMTVAAAAHAQEPAASPSCRAFLASRARLRDLDRWIARFGATSLFGGVGAYVGGTASSAAVRSSSALVHVVLARHYATEVGTALARMRGFAAPIRQAAAELRSLRRLPGLESRLGLVAQDTFGSQAGRLARAYLEKSVGHRATTPELNALRQRLLETLERQAVAEASPYAVNGARMGLIEELRAAVTSTQGAIERHTALVFDALSAQAELRALHAHLLELGVPERELITALARENIAVDLGSRPILDVASEVLWHDHAAYGILNSEGRALAGEAAVARFTALATEATRAARMARLVSILAGGTVGSLTGWLIVDNFIFPASAGHPTEETVASVVAHPEVLLNAPSEDLTCAYLDAYPSVRRSAGQFAADVRALHTEAEAQVGRIEAAADAEGISRELVGNGSLVPDHIVDRLTGGSRPAL